MNLNVFDDTRESDIDLVTGTGSAKAAAESATRAQAGLDRESRRSSSRPESSGLWMPPIRLSTNVSSQGRS